MNWPGAASFLKKTQRRFRERRYVGENVGENVGEEEEVDADGGEGEDEEAALGSCMGWKGKWTLENIRGSEPIGNRRRRTIPSIRSGPSPGTLCSPTASGGVGLDPALPVGGRGLSEPRWSGWPWWIGLGETMSRSRCRPSRADSLTGDKESRGVDGTLMETDKPLLSSSERKLAAGHWGEGARGAAGGLGRCGSSWADSWRRVNGEMRELVGRQLAAANGEMRELVGTQLAAGHWGDAGSSWADSWRRANGEMRELLGRQLAAGHWGDAELRAASLSTH
ncbi:hypothetical protein CYMTET_48459 [Cymbomonas tetramitiformis]|uniref:Uncharacterized protein n=1 Tax=Cymbomonas tetramitiformis TaxID=36881 RepID=A0AAE0EV50_9CHLO|nr:hypothetical protein CYMTET_48459 [Cymbomonas tetramitiformis]